MAAVKQKFVDVSESTAFSGAQPILNSLRNSNSAITLNHVKGRLSVLDSYTKHRFFKRRFSRLQVWAPYQGYRVEMDLLSMDHYSSDNNDIKFLFNVVDQFSRMAYTEPLKSKSPKEVAQAFRKILNRAPFTIQSIYADDGNEWKGDMLKLTDAHHIKRIVATSWVKASIVERFQKTLKLRLIRYMRQQHSYRYVDALQQIVTAINNTVNRTLHIAPAAVNFSNQQEFYKRWRLERRLNFKRPSPRYAVGDDVIVGLKTSIFKRGYEQNFSDEVFRVVHVYPTTPITYKLEDRKHRTLPRKYYERELQVIRFDPDHLYDIDEIRGSKGAGRNAKTLVHFATEPLDAEEWIKSSSLEAHRTHNQQSFASVRVLR